jgi:hypothetical protein
MLSRTAPLLCSALLALVARPVHAEDPAAPASPPADETAESVAPDAPAPESPPADEAAESAAPDAAPDAPPPVSPPADETVADAPAGTSEEAPVPSSALGELLGLPGEVSSSGELAIESRAFVNDKDALTEDVGLGLRGRLEWRHTHGPFEEKLRVTGRLDGFDSARTVLVAEEAYLQYKSGSFRLRLGSDMVNWTATEAFHPADVINARNLDSDLENLEKVGEPMLSMQLRLAEGTTVQALVMPVRMRTLFPSPASRLNLAEAGTDLRGRSLLLDRDGHFTDSDFGPQAALRLQQTLGGADLSVHVLEHMDRTQPLVALSEADGRPVAVFQTVRQVGGTYQQEVVSGLLAKVEAAYRWFVAPSDPGETAASAGVIFFGPPFPGRNHGTVALGFEYALSHEGGGQSTFLLETQAVLGLPSAAAETLTPFQRDLLLGYRLALEDEDDKALLLGLIVDLQDARERLLSLTYQQRLGEVFTVKAAVRFLDAPEEGSRSALSFLRGAHHLRITLVRHF